MAYQIEIVPVEDCYVHLHVTGHWTLDISSDLIREVFDLYHSSGRPYLLADFSDMTSETDMSIEYRSAMQAIRLGAHSVNKTAIVNSIERKRFTDFTESVLRNRGVNIRLFYNLEEARKWLTESAGYGSRSS